MDPGGQPPGSSSSLDHSLEAIYHRLEGPLLLYATKLVRDEEVAQDLVQEAFLRLQPRLREVAHPRPWLYRTVHNLAMSHHRSQRRVVPIEDGRGGGGEGAPGGEETDPEPLPDAQLERLEAIGLARLFLRDLDPEAREVIRLKYEQEYSYRQISEATGITIDRVGYVLRKTLKTLAAEMAGLEHKGS